MYPRNIFGPVVLAVAFCLLPVIASAEDDPETSPGISAPNWNLRCADGSRVDFHEALAEGPVLLSYWALWCKPCLKELPHLDKLATEFGDRLTVWAVNIDSPKSVAKVRPYLKSKRYKLTVPLDTSGDLARLMQVGGMVPFVALYDQTGKEVYKHVGFKEGDELELHKQVQALLGEPAAAEVEPERSEG